MRATAAQRCTSVSEWCFPELRVQPKGGQGMWEGSGRALESGRWTSASLRPGLPGLPPEVQSDPSVREKSHTCIAVPRPSSCGNKSLCRVRVTCHNSTLFSGHRPSPQVWLRDETGKASCRERRREARTPGCPGGRGSTRAPAAREGVCPVNRWPRPTGRRCRAHSPSGASPRAGQPLTTAGPHAGTTWGS